MFAELFNKKILFITGKGGTGKSVVSALLGLLAAQKGKRVLLVESHAFDKLAPLFGLAPIGHQETLVSDRLSCINLDAKRCFAEYVTLHLGMEALYERVFRSQPVSSLLDAIPGLDETMVLGRVFHTCELSNAKYDLVIFDCPASGHFLKMFATPDAIIKTGLVGPLIREVERVKSFLSNPEKASGIVVSLPEALVMTETFEFLPLFNKVIPLHLSAVILNRAYSFAAASFLTATEKYFDRKQRATKEARKELFTFLQKNPGLAQTAYTFPDMELIAEPLTLQKLADFLPLIEEFDFVSESH